MSCCVMVIKYCVLFSTSCAYKCTQKRQWRGMADWCHVQITCSISGSHVAEMQLHSSPFNHECRLLEQTHIHTKKKTANSYRTELELDFQEVKHHESISIVEIIKQSKT